MKKLIFISYVFIFMMIISCKSLPRGHNTMYGMIYDGESSPVNDARITINDKKVIFSDVYGHFLFQKAALGKTYIIKATKNGYEPLEINIPFSNASQFIYLKMYSASQLLSLAEKKIASKNYNDAYDNLSRAENAGASYISLNYLKALIEYNKHNYQESINFLKILLDSDINNPYIYLLCADNYQYGFNDINSTKLMLEKYLEITYDPEIEERYKSLCL